MSSEDAKLLRSFLIMVLIKILYRVGSLNSVSAVCELSFRDGNTIYNFSLTSPISNFPHGVLSEDGFYKVVVNETVLRFQLCSGMIFNHDLPKCIDCLDCGLPSHCGIGCSAIVTKNEGGYDVCTTLGHVLSMTTNVIDNHYPHKGVMVNMSSTGSKHNCSLSVSVLCDPNGIQGPRSLEKLGFCDYATVLHHPSSCAMITYGSGNGLGWFGNLMIIVLCLLGGYLFVGITYRHFFLGVQGLDVIPNLDFWAGLPHRIKASLASVVLKFRGPTEVHRNSYSRVSF